MAITCLYIPHLHYTDNLNEDILIQTVPVTKNTGRLHAGCASFEYLPCKAFENRSYIETRNQNAMVISGTAQIENEVKNGSNMNFDVKYVLEETQIELPYIYYLGYNITLENNGQKVKLKTYETENGFVGVKVPVLEKGKIEVKYKGTAIMQITKWISIFSIIIIICYKIRKKLSYKQNV